MPEYPEVHTVIETLKEFTLAKTIKDVKVLRAKNVEGDLSSLIGCTIKSFSQIGKFIVFHFDDSKVLISHLRMEGKYFLRKEDEPYQKHDIASLIFTDKTALIYNDARKFGILKVSDEKHYLNEEPLNKVGPDPFKMKDAKRLENCFKNKSIAIKTALLDQSVMSGLGNIYVDEVLFECKVHPETPAKLVNYEKLSEILLSSRKILSEAIKQGGSTIKSYHPKEGVSGNFQVSLKVYGKKDGICPRCHHHLRKIFVNGRGTTYCPKCQKNPALVKVIAITGPIGSGKSEVLRLFEKHGYKTLSADLITHNLYKEKSVQNEIKKFIPTLIIRDKEIDRDYLREYLLENPNKKKRLEKYVHSLVSDYIINEIKHSKQNIAMEVPLLFESHLDDFADEIIYVDASDEVRRKRLIKRDKNYKESLNINSSFNIENKKKATHVIMNNDSIANLDKQIKTICGK